MTLSPLYPSLCDGRPYVEPIDLNKRKKKGKSANNTFH